MVSANPIRKVKIPVILSVVKMRNAWMASASLIPETKRTAIRLVKMVRNAWMVPAGISSAIPPAKKVRTV